MYTKKDIVNAHLPWIAYACYFSPQTANNISEILALIKLNETATGPFRLLP